MFEQVYFKSLVACAISGAVICFIYKDLEEMEPKRQEHTYEVRGETPVKAVKPTKTEKKALTKVNKRKKPSYVPVEPKVRMHVL